MKPIDGTTEWTTLDLLDEAIEHFEMTTRQLSMHLGYSPWTLSRARERGSLSPLIAGEIAALMERDIEHWMALAALENEPDSKTTRKLRELIEHAANS